MPANTRSQHLKLVPSGGATSSAYNAFGESVYGQFWAEASTAAAFSRKGRVHLVAKVRQEHLLALHEAQAAGRQVPWMTQPVTARDLETLGGMMMYGIVKEGDHWMMGDGVTVKFFKEIPGPEVGEVVKPITIRPDPEADRYADLINAELRRRAAEVAATKREGEHSK